MSAKISARRREAFLRAVRETGNQTLACERAKVSGSWVTLHRSTDPAFDQAVIDAVAAYAGNLLRDASSPGSGPGAAAPQDERSGMEPPAGWRHHAGEELVVRGTGGSAFKDAGGGERRVPKRVQVARARLRQWTPRGEDRFLTELKRTCNVKASCAFVGLSQASAYNHRHRWQDFARRWDAVLDMGMMELEWALLQAAGKELDEGDLPAMPSLRDMTPGEAIYLLEMHKRRQGREAGQWGRPPREPDIEEVRAEVLYKVDVALRHQARTQRPT